MNVFISVRECESLSAKIKEETSLGYLRAVTWRVCRLPAQRS